MFDKVWLFLVSGLVVWALLSADHRASGSCERSQSRNPVFLKVIKDAEMRGVVTKADYQKFERSALCK